jgi:hypothetical protein
MPPQVRASVRIQNEVVARSEAVTPEVPLITTAETLRATIVRAGGNRPRVQLRMTGQHKPFSADLSKELIAADDFHVYRDAEVTGIFRRDPQAIGMPIVSGVIHGVRFLASGS